MPLHPRARETTMELAGIRSKRGHEKVTGGFERYPPSQRCRAIVDAVSSRLSPSGHLPMCNRYMRKLATETLVDVLLSHYDRVRHQPDVRHFFFTATFDTGITFERTPKVNVAAMIRKVRDMLTALDLQALCVLEIDVLSKKQPGDDDRLIVFQIHGVVWTRDPSFQPQKVGADQSKRACFRHRLGVPAIKFVSRQASAQRHRRPDGQLDLRFRKLDRDQTARSMASMAGYMLKHPLKAKHRYLDREGAVHVYDDERAFRLKTALRMAELWSHITPQQAVFAVGCEGRQLGLRFRVQLRQRLPSMLRGRGVNLDRAHLAASWSHYFAAHPELGFSSSQLNQRDFR